MDKATPTPASVDSVMAKAMMLVGALGDSCEAVTSLPFLEAVTALREEADRLAAQAAPTGLTDMGWVIDAANEGELAAYDQGCAECQQAVAKILDGKDTGDGTANPPWELLRRRLIALVAAQPSQAPVVQAGEYPPRPFDNHFDQAFRPATTAQAVRMLTPEEEHALCIEHGATVSAHLLQAIQRKFCAVNAGKRIPADGKIGGV